MAEGDVRRSLSKSNNHYKNLFNAQYSRKYGGTKPGTADPYIQGYLFTLFDELPKPLDEAVADDKIGKASGGEEGGGDTIKNLLSGSCIGCTIPGGTLNKETFNGLGGMKWAVPTNVDWGDTVTLTFNEFSGTPISRLHEFWVKMMRDPVHGVSELDTYTKGNYAGTLYIWTTEPNTLEIEKAYCYTGIFPVTEPTDQFGTNVNNIGKVELNIDYNVDYIFNGDHHDWVYSQCNQFLSTIRKTGAFEKIGKPIGVSSDEGPKNYTLSKVTEGKGIGAEGGEGETPVE